MAKLARTGIVMVTWLVLLAQRFVITSASASLHVRSLYNCKLYVFWLWTVVDWLCYMFYYHHLGHAENNNMLLEILTFIS